MKKATAKAYSNIALVKYWGKGDEKLRLPVNSSLAVGLDSLSTVTTVEFNSTLNEDTVQIDNDQFSQEEVKRVSDHLDLIRAKADIDTRAKIVTKNTFPKGVGAASSASGFAALTVAAAAAANLNLDQRELSIIARQGSGSAARSIPGGLSIWHSGTSNETSFAEPIPFPSEWDLRILLVFVGEHTKQKKIGSTDGMALASTSPYFEIAVQEAASNISRINEAINQSDWELFGQVVEDECYRLHLLCMSSHPNILYWQGETVAVFQTLYQLREEGVVGYFTVDAGPHVHIVCRRHDAEKIKSAVEKISGVSEIVECGVGGPAEVINDHLF